jgi:hypothetical protein
MVRAASLEVGMSAVVSTTTEFLNAARVGEAEISCEVVRRSSFLCCVNCSAAQDGRDICRGTTWLSGGSVPQLYSPNPPAAPDWAQVRHVAPGPFSKVIEQRPVNWIDDYPARPESTPYSLTWVRFLPGSPGSDVVTRACEVLVAGDLFPVLAMMTAFPRHEARVVAVRTLTLSAQMASLDGDSERLLIETSCSYMSEAILTGVVRVWSESMVLRGQVMTTYSLPPGQPRQPVL